MAGKRASGRKNGIALMIVDDHPMWRDSLRRVLEHMKIGSVVAEASDGGEAVKVAISVRPDVIVMDMYLPTMNGVEATRAILTEQPGAKVLVLSASDRKADVLSAVQSGVSGYLLKTANPSDVADAVLRVHRGEVVLPPSVADVVLAEFRRLSDGGVPASPGPEAASEAAMFRREGDFWTVSFAGRTVRLRDSRGMRYLAELLAHPGREIHVADLGAAREAAGAAPRPGELRPGPGDAGEILDSQARARYRERLRELEDELAEAHQWGDGARITRLQDEIDILSRHLAAAYGLGGRARKAADPNERIRKAVGNRVHDALARIDAEHPALGRHLALSVITGTFCSYVPAENIRWAL